MRPFDRLDVWKLAHEVVLEVYGVTRSFPADERFGLTSQVRRSAAGVAANIVEGSAANSAAEFARFLNIAEREAAETAYHLVLARDLGYLKADAATTMLAKVASLRRMLNRFRPVVSGRRRTTTSQAGPDQ